MISFNQARELFLAAARPVQETELIPTLYAEGRVLAEDVVSTINVPCWDNSQMDGYCVRFVDVQNASEAQPVQLPVSQRIPAGAVGEELKPETCARIFTGAPLPPGADTVIPQEDVLVSEDKTVSFVRTPARGEWVRHTGSDIAVGHTVAKAGELITAAKLGLIASIGVDYVTVYKSLKVAILFSGSELTAPGEPLAPGKIYNSNRYTLRALLKKLHCEVFDIGTVHDNLELTRVALEKASKAADVVISVGGMSVGEEDHIKNAVEMLGEIDLWKIAIKPGKPVALGKIGDVPFIGIPGNPVSCFVTFLLFARPFLMRSQGIADVLPVPLEVRADFSWPKQGAREEFVRVRRNGAGGLDLFPNQNSQVLTSCAWADGVVDIPAGQRITQGQLVQYYSFGDFVK